MHVTSTLPACSRSFLRPQNVGRTALVLIEEVAGQYNSGGAAARGAARGLQVASSGEDEPGTFDGFFSL
jgi:hypothetical protein